VEQRDPAERSDPFVGRREGAGVTAVLLDREQFLDLR
jgi:hypothetical protein